MITHRKKAGELINDCLNTTALSILGTPQRKDEFVFDVQNFSINRLNKTINYWVQREEINKHITFHCAKHTFACLLLLYGANLKTVADAMGHSSTKAP
ncbi:tyrosine-type recombinase/integrase [Maribacter algicola]|uniref:tyrosine-type recombinase/integrase n=1 Tax=Maribacter algicola TaxID=2498892 RepID=UPI001402B2F1